MVVEVYRLFELFVNATVVDRINQLLAQLLENPKPVTSIDISRELLNPNSMIFLAHKTDDHKTSDIIGLAFIFFQWRFSGWLAEIHDVVVDSAYRGQHIGDMLTAKLLDAARRFAEEKKQKVTIYLTSKPARESANLMYRKHGFELVATATGEAGTNLYKLP